MANLKRNMIELIKEVKEGEIITEKYLTPVFIPFSIVYEALDMVAEIDKSKTEKDLLDKMMDFVATRIYNNQFTKETLLKGYTLPTPPGFYMSKFFLSLKDSK